MNWDQWSTEVDVDLFYRIEQTYKDIYFMDYDYEDEINNTKCSIWLAKRQKVCFEKNS